jgi:hypothetical protein
MAKEQFDCAAAASIEDQSNLEVGLEMPLLERCESGLVLEVMQRAVGNETDPRKADLTNADEAVLCITCYASEDEAKVASRSVRFAPEDQIITEDSVAEGCSKSQILTSDNESQEMYGDPRSMFDV